MAERGTGRLRARSRRTLPVTLASFVATGAAASGLGMLFLGQDWWLAGMVAAALELLVAQPGESHTLNCGYGRGFSVLEVLDAVDRVTNHTIERRMEGRRAGDPAELVADNSAILAALPWRPERDDLDGIVRDALAWERKLAEKGR